MDYRWAKSQAVPVPSFARTSVAYKDGVQYAANAKRTQSAAITSVSDGAIPAGEGSGSEHIEGCCYNGTYLFGLGLTTYRLYKSADGVTWNTTGLDTTARNGTLWALANGNLIWFNTDLKTIFYSSNNGQSFTQGTITMQATAFFNTWSFCQNGNTLILVEYGPSGSGLQGRYIHRSVNGGATWTQVADLETQTPDGYHWHTVAYHAATGRWIAFFGDYIANRGVVYSDDDGVTWNNLHYAGDYPDQPVTWIDTGDPTRLLVGCDGSTCIGWFDVLTGEIESVFQFGDGRGNRFYCWTLAKVGGVYYAGNYDSNASSEPVLWVSKDLVNWTVYHKFIASEGVYGFFGYIGHVGGKLHFQLQTGGAGNFRRFTISPARVVNATGTLVEAATTNLANTENLSSFETTNTWTGISGLTAERYAMPHVGGYGIRIYGADGAAGTKNAYGQYAAMGDAGVAKKYILHLRIKATRPVVCIFRLYSQTLSNYYDDTKQSFILADKNWKHFRSYPFTIAAGDNGNFRPYLSVIQGTRGAEVFIDCFQIQEVPISEWQIGGTARTADVLTETITTPSAWTDSFAIQTIGMEEHYITAANLYIKTWRFDANNFVSLYFNVTDKKFYIQRTIAGAPQAAVGTAAAQVWHPSQNLRFAFRANASGISLAAQNGRTIATITDGAMPTILSAAITMIYGNASSAAQFPGVVLDGTVINIDIAGIGFVPFWVNDEDIVKSFGADPTVSVVRQNPNSLSDAISNSLGVDE